jgi:hypothetical protein
MLPKRCSNCGGGAEWPSWVGTDRLPDELLHHLLDAGHEPPAPRERVMCITCLENYRAEAEYVAELESKYRAGLICFVCQEVLDPPGGVTAWSFDRTQLLRVCVRCHDGLEASRGF